MRLPTHDGPLAQLVEQRTFNPLVVGSNPTRPTICKPFSDTAKYTFLIKTRFSNTFLRT